jgi:hypothetical protein
MGSTAHGEVQRAGELQLLRASMEMPIRGKNLPRAMIATTSALALVAPTG